MVAKKEDVMTKLESEFSLKIKTLCDMIDNDLQKCGWSNLNIKKLCNGGQFNLSEKPTVIKWLKKLYEDAGWTITLDDGYDQRDGTDWCTLDIR